jgi:hypothetical protein
MKRVRNLAILNFVFYIIAFIVSQMSQFNLIGGNTMGDVSAKYESVFTPAGITFSIWGVIYIGLFAFTIYHLIQAYKKDIHSEANQVIQKMGYYFVANNLATAAWVFAWLYEYIALSLVLMIIQLYTLVKIHAELKIYDPQKSVASKLFTQVPLSLYFAWICIATIANVSSFFVYIGWDGGGISPSVWAIILIVVATLLSVFIISFKQNPYFGLVVLWALYGIHLKRVEINETLYQDVIKTVWLCFAFLSILVLFKIISNYRQSKKSGAAPVINA